MLCSPATQQGRSPCSSLRTDDLDELRQRLRLIRAYIATLKKPELDDLDALLSVAEAELQRVHRDRPPGRFPESATVVTLPKTAKAQANAKRIAINSGK